MDAALAGRHLWNLRRAWAGANLCRDRLAEAHENAPMIAGAKDMRGIAAHDVDYYAWECVRVIKIAQKAVAAGLRQREKVEAALEAFRLDAPHLEAFRDQVTHVEDNRGADDIAYFGDAVRLLPNGNVEYVVDPRYEHHDRLRELFAVTERSLMTLAPPDGGSPFPRYGS